MQSPEVKDIHIRSGSKIQEVRIQARSSYIDYLCKEHGYCQRFIKHVEWDQGIGNASAAVMHSSGVWTVIQGCT